MTGKSKPSETAYIKPNPVDYENCRCLNCGEVFKVDEENGFHLQQLCRQYCAMQFAESLK